jgi:EAL domain-containing protein (putative c-di-GMP-specific phosphodiesterase class I)
LDDFGSGMSSFSYLKHLPVDFVKIDGAFVKDMAHNPVDFAMVEAIHNIAHRMGLGTVAEFVENDETISLLRKMGVDHVQGYGVEKPRPLDRISGSSKVLQQRPASLTV